MTQGDELLTGSVMYLPVEDADFTEFARKWKNIKPDERHVIHGKKTKNPFKKSRPPLSAIATTAKLYVVLHGDPTKPLVGAGGSKFNANQLAERLEKDGLKKLHQDLRLYSCYSGLATHLNPPPVTPELRKTLESARRGDELRIIENAGFKRPQRYPEDPEKQKSLNSPMAAYLCSSMKARGFNNISVTGYFGGLYHDVDDEGILTGQLYPVGRYRKGILVGSEEGVQGGLGLASRNKIVFDAKNWNGVTWV